MASLRFRNGKWQVQVRRHGHIPQARSFQSKADAQRWARQMEVELDRTLIPHDVRALSTVTVADCGSTKTSLRGVCRKQSD